MIDKREPQAEPQIENPRGLALPAGAGAILRRMFPAHRRVVVKAELGGGWSGSRVLVVQPIQEASELPAVVKLAPVSLIEQEYRAYRQHIHDRLSGVAEVRGEPVLVAGSDWGGLRYHLVGSGIFESESLNSFCRRANLDEIQDVLGRLFRRMGPLWRFSQASSQFDLRSSYDGLLPVNLLIKPATPPPGVPVHALEPGALTDGTFQRGDYVRLQGWLVTEMDPLQKTVTLNLPGQMGKLANGQMGKWANGQMGEWAHMPWRAVPGNGQMNSSAGALPVSYRLRLQPVESPEVYQVNQVVDVVEGVVTATRYDLLQGYAPDSLTLSDGATLPNPLDALQSILAEPRDVKIAGIHGDLNLENILVDPDTHDVRLIDFAEARQDHVLHDLLRIETGIVTWHVSETLAQASLPPETIHGLYEQLHGASDHSSALKPAHSALDKPLRLLLTLRAAARNYLFDPDDWSEYYQGLALYLLGALKFETLDATAKKVAFWGAATLVDLMDKPLPPARRPTRRKVIAARLAKALAVLAVAALLVLAAVVVRVLFFGPDEKPRSAPVVASIISFQPEVDVKRTGTSLLVPTTFNQGLYHGDVVNAYVGAAASVICENGLLFSLPEQSNLTIDCQGATGARFMIGRLDPGLGELSVSRSAAFALAAEQSRAPRLALAGVPLLLNPRNTVISDTRPSFYWQPVAGAAGYRLTLGLPGGEAWSRETSAARMSYPGDVPPQEPGSANVVVLAALDGAGQEMATDRTLFQVLGQAGRVALAEAEAQVRALGLDETAQTYLLAQVYRERGMWAAASGQLELLAARGVSSASLWEQLGDLYFQTGLYTQAEECYREAQAAALAAADLDAQAAAHLGLARAAHAFEETEQLFEHLGIAEALYRQAGEQEKAEQVLAERKKLEE